MRNIESRGLVLLFATVLLQACGSNKSSQVAVAPPISAPAAAPAVPDLSGVWKVTQPIATLLTSAGQVPPLLPATLALYQQRRAAADRGDHSWDSSTTCKPPGEPRTMWEMAWPFEIVQTKDRVEFLYQWNHLLRSVPLLPKQQAFMGPFYFGQSVGQFQGNALVVDVVGVNSDTYLDSAGLPHSDGMHLTERFALDATGQVLTVTLHVEDPATYSAPWDTQVQFARLPAGSVLEDDCEVRLHQESRYPVLPQKLYPK